MTNVRDWDVVVTTDDGDAIWMNVSVTVDEAHSWAEEATSAMETARSNCNESGIRVAEIRVDWQQMFESTAADLQEANACIEALTEECCREDSRGFEYIDKDDFNSVLQQYGRL
jgi:hypothetical protein